jgi:hypothetical protein
MSTPWLDNKNLSQKLYTALAWPPGVHERLDFPFAIQSISYVNGGDIVVALLFKEDKEELRLEDAAAGFPSQELLAQLNLLAGNVASRLRAEHRREVAKRVEKDRLKSKYSNRPW